MVLTAGPKARYWQAEPPTNVTFHSLVLASERRGACPGAAAKHPREWPTSLQRAPGALRVVPLPGRLRRDWMCLGLQKLLREFPHSLAAKFPQLFCIAGPSRTSLARARRSREARSACARSGCGSSRPPARKRMRLASGVRSFAARLSQAVGSAAPPRKARSQADTQARFVNLLRVCV